MEALERFRFTAGTRRKSPSQARKGNRAGAPSRTDGVELKPPEIEELATRIQTDGAIGLAARPADVGPQGTIGASSALSMEAQESIQGAGVRGLGSTGIKPAVESAQGDRKGRSTVSSWGADAHPPERWKEVLNSVREMRTARDAPVDLFGTRQCVDPDADLETQRFQALVAAMISSQTKDPITAAAMLRLRALPGGLTIANIAASETSLESLQSTLHPVGFFRQKGAHLKAMAQQLAAAPHNGRVPNSAKQLMELPGVGPKVAHLTLVVAFDQPEDGLIVDTHVRRVCERLGWASPDRTPEQTRQAIESWLPKNLWAETSLSLVGFGQQICTPLRPRCQDCRIATVCPSAFKELETKADIKRKKSRVSSKRKQGGVVDSNASLHETWIVDPTDSKQGR